MNRKIKKYLEEIDKTEKKMVELQTYLKGIKAALKEEENNEIIRSIRSKHYNSKELLEVLSGIQNGTVVLSKTGEIQKIEVKKEEPRNERLEKNM